MNKRISLGLSIALILISISVTFAITMAVSRNIYDSLVSDLSQRKTIFSAMEELDGLVRKYYYGQIDEIAHNAQIASGYMEGLGDPNSYYLTSDEHTQYKNRMEGNASGIGVEVYWNKQTEKLQVTKVFASSPASKNGLARGDEIIEIEGTVLTQENHAEQAQKLEGKRLTSVTLTYRRDKVEKTVNIILGYTYQSVYSEMIGDVGYISISAFYSNTLAQFQTAVESMLAKGATALVLDVRNTSKGSIDYAAKVIDYLAPLASEGTKAVATLVNKNGDTIDTFTSEASHISIQMAVLMNAGTSGLGELFACDLKDFGKAVLVGEQTAGNASAQRLFPLSDGGAIVLTYATMLPYISSSFAGTGLSPDVVISLSEEQAENFDLLAPADDLQVQTAVALFASNK